MSETIVKEIEVSREEIVKKFPDSGKAIVEASGKEYRPERKDTICSNSSSSSTDEESLDPLFQDDPDYDDDENRIHNRKDTSSSEGSTTSDDLNVTINGPIIVKLERVATVDSEESSREHDSESDLPFFDAIEGKTQHGADANRRDSGIEADKGQRSEEEDFVVPEEELIQKIVEQVEYYFADENIVKDAFLLKHVRRNKEGLVSIKLVTCFKRVKHLTKDWRQVAYALKSSDKLEVNDLGTKVRRKCALPEFDETLPSRTVVAYNLPVENPTVASVSELFSPCGEITLVRILRSGTAIPGEIKQFLSKHPEVGDKACALVEFEQSESARKAVKEMSSEEADGMKILELVLKPKKERKYKTLPPLDVRRMSLGTTDSEEENVRRQFYYRGRRGSRVEMLRDESSGLSGSETDNSHGRRYIYTPSPMSSPCCSPTYRRAFGQHRPSFGYFDFPHTAIPLVPPRQIAARHSIASGDIWGRQRLQPTLSNPEQFNRRLSTDATGNRLMPPMEHVLRQPRGPDQSGSRGFTRTPPHGVNWRTAKPRSGSVPTVIFTPTQYGN